MSPKGRQNAFHTCSPLKKPATRTGFPFQGCEWICALNQTLRRFAPRLATFCHCFAVGAKLIRGLLLQNHGKPGNGLLKAASAKLFC
jgi:hypothetical protein